jgi:hypothetical protein
MSQTEHRDIENIQQTLLRRTRTPEPGTRTQNLGE